MYKEEMEFSRIKKIPKYFLMFWLEAADLRQFRVFFFEKERKRERRSTIYRLFGKHCPIGRLAPEKFFNLLIGKYFHPVYI